MSKTKITFMLFIIFFLISTHQRFARSKNTIYIDSFQSSKENKFPLRWVGRGKKAFDFYKVVKEKLTHNKYLKVVNINSDMMILKKKKIDIVKYPFLNWKWRTHKYPPQGNESVKKYCDSVASVYVILYASKWRPKSIKYSWSTTLTKGTITKSPYCVWPAQCDIVILRSGKRLKEKWIFEKRNVLTDYKRFYKKENVESFIIDGIVIMSDSDNTHSIVEADYDSIYFSKN